MRIPIGIHRSRLEMNMIPMIDVVFLLIIFFLVSSHLAKQEVQAELALPIAETGVENQDADQRRLTVNIAAENGNYTIKFGSRSVNTNDLQQYLERELERSNTDLEVRIRGDREIPYQIVEPVMVACARLGIWNVHFAVIRSVDAR